MDPIDPKNVLSTFQVTDIFLICLMTEKIKLICNKKTRL